MNRAILNAGEFLPQPPQEMTAGMSPSQVNALAIENMLAGTNSEFKCLLLVNMSYVPEPVASIRDRLTDLYTPDTTLPVPQLGNVRNKIRDYLSKDTVEYDGEKDTVRLIEGSEPIIAFAGLLLAASLDNSVPIGKVNPQSREQHSWHGFQNLSHLRRLLFMIRLAQSGSGGIKTKSLVDDLGEFSTEIGESNRLTTRLAREGYLSIRKVVEGGRLQNINTATANMGEMCKSVSSALTLMYVHPDELQKRGAEAIDRVLNPSYVPYLYFRSIRVSGHSGPQKVQSLLNSAAVAIGNAPGGQLTYPELYEIIGPSEGYDSYTSFQVALSRGIKRQRQPVVIADDSEGYKKQKLALAPEPSRRYA